LFNDGFQSQPPVLSPTLTGKNSKKPRLYLEESKLSGKTDILPLGELRAQAAKLAVKTIIERPFNDE